MRNRNDISNAQADILKEEYVACRDLILKNIELLEKTEIVIIIAAATSAAFSITFYTNGVQSKIFRMHQSLYSVTYLMAFLPIVITYFGVLRFMITDRAIGIYNDYIEQIEAVYSFNVGNIRLINLTNFFRERNRRLPIRLFHHLLWVVATLLSGGFSWWFLETVNIGIESCFNYLPIISSVIVIILLVVSYFSSGR